MKSERNKRDHQTRPPAFNGAPRAAAAPGSDTPDGGGVVANGLSRLGDDLFAVPRTALNLSDDLFALSDDRFALSVDLFAVPRTALGDDSFAVPALR